MGGIDEDWRWFLVLGPQIGYCKCGACFVASGKAPSIFPSTPNDLADAMRKMGDARPQGGLKMWET